MEYTAERVFDGRSGRRIFLSSIYHQSSRRAELLNSPSTRVAKVMETLAQCVPLMNW